MTDQLHNLGLLLAAAVEVAGGTILHAALRLGWTIVLIVAVLLVGRWVRARVRGTLVERHLANNVPILVDNLLRLGVYILIGTLILGLLGTDTRSLVTALGLLTAAISLSLQDVLKNFVAGLYLLAEQLFRVGERIQVTGAEGSVERVDIRTTVLRNDRAQQVLVPNARVFSEIVTNRSRSRLRQLVVQVAGIPLSAQEADAAAREVLRDLPGQDGTVPPRIDLTRIGADSCDLTVTVWYALEATPRQAVLLRLHAGFPAAVLTAPLP